MDVKRIKPDRMSKLCPAILVCLAALTLFTSCEFDQGIGLLKSKISGKVNFVATSARPDNVDEVRVIAVANLPPQGFGEIFFSDALRFDSTEADYELYLPFDNYSAIGILWKPRGEDWSINNLFGLYDLSLTGGDLRSIQLTEEQPIADNVDISALWFFANTDATIKGEITFQGDWPENTETVLMQAFTKVPNLDDIASSFATWGRLPFALPKSVDTHNYEMPVFHNDYEFIGIFWVGGGTVDLKKLPLIGYYRDSNDETQPGKITLEEGEVISDITINVDLNSLPQGLQLGGEF